MPINLPLYMLEGALGLILPSDPGNHWIGGGGMIFKKKQSQVKTTSDHMLLVMFALHYFLMQKHEQ